MGLDQYLSKKSYVQNWEHNQKKHEIKVNFDGILRASKSEAKAIPAPA